MDRLVDGFGRRFRYLRLSVTEVCNFRCTYCLPDGFKKSGAPTYLKVDEIAPLAAAFSSLGVSKVRLTGGEPTVRRDLDQIIACIAETPGVRKVALTTNGWNLKRRIRDWRAAGLSHLNVSIDSLDPGRFKHITGHDRLVDVLDGVDEALAVGVVRTKVNAVLLRDSGAGVFEEFAEYVRERPIAVRFIELMRTGDNADFFADQHVSGTVLSAWLEARGWSPCERGADAGPAAEYAHPDYAGRLGLIAPYAPGFCDSCNRLRLTSRGRLQLCLFGDGGVDLRQALRRGEDVRERIVDALTYKPAGHRLREGITGTTRRLAQVGG